MASYDPDYRDSDQKPAWWVSHYNETFPDDPVERYVYLPHQCDDWRIGDVEDVKALIADLQALLEDVPAVRTR